MAASFLGVHDNVAGGVPPGVTLPDVDRAPERALRLLAARSTRWTPRASSSRPPRVRPPRLGEPKRSPGCRFLGRRIARRARRCPPRPSPRRGTPRRASGSSPRRWWTLTGRDGAARHARTSLRGTLPARQPGPRRSTPSTSPPAGTPRSRSAGPPRDPRATPNPPPRIPIPSARPVPGASRRERARDHRHPAKPRPVRIRGARATLRESRRRLSPPADAPRRPSPRPRAEGRSPRASPREPPSPPPAVSARRPPRGPPVDGHPTDPSIRGRARPARRSPRSS